MRVLILTQWFEPESAFKGLTFAKELQRRGYQVEVLTGFPNYPEGKVYQGYKVKFYQKEVMDGISIVRVPLYPSHDISAIKRMINYLSFSFAATFIGSFLVKSADVMYVYHPPVTIGLPAVVIKYLRRVPFVYDIQDLWPDTLSSTGMLNNKTLLKIVDRFCCFLYKQADVISVLSPGFKSRLISRGVPEDKINIIYNWAEEGIEKVDKDIKCLKRTYSFEDKFNVLFAGNMGKAQALGSVLDAAELMKKNCPDVQFVFVGDGVEVGYLKNEKKNRKLDNVIFIDRVSKTEIVDILFISDALLVHLKNDALFEITIPSKLQAYFAAGRPVIVGVRGDAANLVEKANAGLVCVPENAESISKSVMKLYSMPEERRAQLGENGKIFYEKYLSFAAGVTKFEGLIKSVCQE